MTQTQAKMTTLYSRLSEIGLTPTFIRKKALPDWWDKSLESNPAAVAEAAGYIARRLGLDVASLLKSDKPITFKNLAETKIKNHQNAIENLLPQSMAARIAEMVAYACIQEYKTLPDSAKFLRKIILKGDDYGVNLDAFLEICWGYGIPVVHFSSFPRNARQIDGIAAYFYNHPVIVISSKCKYSASLLFIAAHKLGHIVLNHLKNQNSLIIDEKGKRNSEIDEGAAANAFAIELLLGKPDICYQAPRNLTANQLADMAYKIAERDKVDPGVVALNFSWNKGYWRAGMEAMKIIEPNANAPQKINSYLEKYLDFEQLDSDSQDYLKLVTGV